MQNNKKGFSNLVLVVVIIIVVLVVLGVYFLVTRYSNIQSIIVTPSSATDLKKYTQTVPNVSSFEGEVYKGNSFEKDMGNNLVFKLTPGNGGWTISVFNSQYPDLDYSMFNLPLRFSDARTINNSYGETAVDQVTASHDFNFVINESEYKKGYNALNIMLWPYTYSDKQVQDAENVFNNLTVAHAKFSIESSKTDIPSDNKLGEITYMKFKVEINYPIKLSLCESDENAVPVISSVSSSSVSIGDTIKISGCNLLGFEGDKNIWIQNGSGVKGILYGTRDTDNENIKVAVTSPACEEDTSYSGLPCKSWLTLVPGAYKIYTIPWGKASNKVGITIK